MTEFLEILTHARRLKAQVKELSLEELDEVITKLQGIKTEREEEFAAEQEANAERMAKILEIQEQMAQAGISFDDLNAADVGIKPRKKRAPRPPKYEIMVGGERITWTGQGRTPKAIKERLDAGENLDSFLIQGDNA
ncbi:H-NS histone family protein [Ferrimonas marina]|uniref:DNA-binding protein n=1 Tax=Ferrimonas marina TaxID=299255 RepID=A0A1M5UHE8_9GAMM|nr:H-NS family nucleoid-associated regulatory protein [Ferrimonas marina]SHH62465.1 DNA-binding protein H-NS [Ferrimonas marina]